MSSLSPSIPRRNSEPNPRERERADEAVISQWLLDQTRTTMVRTRAARTPNGRPRRRAAAPQLTGSSSTT